MNDTLKVWFLSPEVAPFAKTGGLADVAGSLPVALKRLGVDVRVGMPFYRAVKKKGFSLRRVSSSAWAPLWDNWLSSDVFETETQDGVPVYLFDREDLFDRPNLYRTPQGDYYDNLERFAFFCQVALFFARGAGFRFDVVHCHDWQTGLVPAYLKTLLALDPFFSKSASLFTIHNVGYQGLFPAEKLRICRIPPEEFHMEGIEYWGQLSLLKAGIVYADAVTTVSPTYSKEIRTPEFGFGMDGILRKRSAGLHGILNGADYGVWDPATDRHIRARYGPWDLEGKRTCKEALLEETGLERTLVDRPLLAMISRLSGQKGSDLLLEIAGDLVELEAGLVVLGTGEEIFQKRLRRLGEKYPSKIAVKIGFDESLAHRIIAGADILLIPSRYEPCGLTQLYALRYGTVPVVRATGGLEDTVAAYDPGTGDGNGFKFLAYDPGAFLDAVRRAIDLFKDKETWRGIMITGMREDFSWDRSARGYLDLYLSIVAGKRKGKETP